VRIVAAAVAFVALCLGVPEPAVAGAGNVTSWEGHSWVATNGGMAGVAQGNPANVFVDSQGFLHLQVVRRNGRYTSAELFSRDLMGFGTYQWWIQGGIDTMDPATVLGLFPYGPQAGIGQDGENELDIEFSKWGGTLCSGKCNADFTFWPSTGNVKIGPAEHDWELSLHGTTLTTARLTWTSTSVTATVMSGLQPLGTTKNVLQTWTYRPANPAVHIPQRAVPLGINFWCYEAFPRTNQSVVIRAFKYVRAS
jgi:hypothetical protein